MSEENKNDKPIEGHEYDGISELDNPLPMWWLITYLVTIGFSFIYFLHVHLTPDNSIADEYAADVREQAAKVSAAPAATAADGAQLAAAASSPEQIAKGREKFVALCVSCHGNEGQGGIGPNLTDNYWLHGRGELADIEKTVRGGVLEKGMPAWGTVLKSDEVVQVVAFVKSIRGTNPAGAKAPQGEEAK
jgi:cytochrome c oxidase cbb3-type subunit 3